MPARATTQTAVFVGEYAMPVSPSADANGLVHVVVAGGTPAEWASMSDAEWITRLDALAQGAGVEGAQWVTLFPRTGPMLSVQDQEQFLSRLQSLRNVSVIRAAHGNRFVWRHLNGLSVIIDPSPDGHVRFAQAIEHLRLDGVQPDALDEDVLTRVLLDPATDEPDLVVIMGPPDVLPESLVWELAYSELVFIDLGWNDLQSSHLELAIDDFNRRHRRFGGLDS